MRYKYKRGQAALEFLMSYGWVIFAALLILASLSFFGVFKPETFISERCSLKPPLFCEDLGFDIASGNVIMKIRNGHEEDINVNEIELSENIDCYALLLEESGDEFKKIDADSSKDFVVDCDLEPGEAVKGDVKVKYAEDPSGLEKVTGGKIIGKVR